MKANKSMPYKKPMPKKKKPTSSPGLVKRAATLLKSRKQSLDDKIKAAGG